MAKRPLWMPIAAGVLVLLAFVAIGVGWVASSWVGDHVTSTDAPADTAAQAFAEVRARFPGQGPRLQLDEHGRPRVAEDAARPVRAGSLESLHVLAWFPKRQRLTRAEIPFWLLRMKSGPITFGAYVTGMDDHGVRLDPSDIERLGPGLLLDADTPDGQHVLVWAQ